MTFFEQFAYENQWVSDSEYPPSCLSCGNTEDERHALDCELASNLDSAGFEVKRYIGPMHGPEAPLEYAMRRVWRREQAIGPDNTLTPTPYGQTVVIPRVSRLSM